ncbi:hypothetical protein [Colwellia psychrerythraea]|uniref:Uncharacterized protein n=1 Tax=Colwellia psychrerythraea TaxID=28229 RepID=A0A099L2Q3_COLPS|nr:hypothetical protein [Colwellia psychrerythraea]KGJ96437.1 hypothetical protein GAB14E_0384 [Colwellia psychrerythraea]
MSIHISIFKALLLSCLVIGLTACGGGGEENSDAETPPKNTISLELPADQTVTEYDSVTLAAVLIDGSNSINSFNWRQKSGITLDLPVPSAGDSHAQLTFITPNVQKDELVTFEFILVHGQNETIKETTITIKAADDDIADMVFEDENFSACVVNQAENKDWKLAREFTSLSCINQDISSAAEIEYFINLTSLTISNQKSPEELVVNANTVKEIPDTNNKLENIDISKLTKLEILNLSYNKLTSIDLSNQLSLRSLALDNNLITEVDLSALSNLWSLHVEENPINEETIEQLIILLKESDITVSFPNQLPQVTVPTLDSIIEYSSVQLVAIAEDVDGFISSYTWRQVSGIDLGLDLSLEDKNWVSFTAPNTNEDLELIFELVVKDDKGEATTKQFSLTIQASPYDLSDIAFEDESFKKCILEQAEFKGYLFSTDFIELTCPNMEISSVKGIELFTNLTKLDLFYNPITSINLTSLTKLTKLSLFGYRLTNLDLTAQTQLISLGIRNYQLTSLDLSAQTKLISLDITNSQLTDLDLSAQTKLISLDITNNQLANLDLSAQTKLISLDITNNQLANLDLSAQENLKNLYANGNELTNIVFPEDPQVSVLALVDNQFTTIDLTLLTELTSLDLSVLGKYNVQFNTIESMDLSKNIKLTDLTIVGQDLSSIDLSTNLNLNSLKLSLNKLSDIDLNTNIKLETLEIRSNLLQAIDLTHATLLEVVTLEVYSLAKLDLSSQNKLKTLVIWNSNLQFLDVTNNHELTTLHVFNSPIYSLFLSEQPSLTSLSLGATSLTWLNLSKQSNLHSIYLSNSYLDTLDLNAQKELRILKLLSNESLTGVDLTAQTELSSLFLSANSNKNYPLLDMNLGLLTKLENLFLRDGALSSIDLSALIELTELTLIHNRLLNIDLNSQSKLIRLNLKDNLLTTIDISSLSLLKSLGITNNPLDDITKQYLDSLNGVNGLSISH